jgi:hypothetical protein
MSKEFRLQRPTEGKERSFSAGPFCKVTKERAGAASRHGGDGGERCVYAEGRAVVQELCGTVAGAEALVVGMVLQHMVHGAPTAAMRRVPAPDFSDCRHGPRRYSEAVVRLVPGDVVRDEPEERWQRSRSQAHSWLRKLPDGMELAAQDATRDGTPWAGPLERTGMRSTKPTLAKARRRSHRGP